ncbi:LysR family transcriptional regulator [Vibrio hannami]|uniref:LysR family transcriptional regulator n=1 Tax=Vibrio hannami TaxID=2717094 RepID=UPI002410985E|nr:LysR family transcriptional regulator [Vibrio hannami]MDG3085802.1 LysR family transcriptional regulator [Vibrio hannami]
MSPYPNLPYSHNSLKGFESVARLMSFTRASNELHVTQSAVSRQVKQLEDDLNASLIVRKHRSIELTEKGQALFAVLAGNYQAVESLLASWRDPEPHRIVIKASLSYATRSLIPKIQHLSERYSEYEIVVIPTIEEEVSDDYDLLIFTTMKPKQISREKGAFFLREEYMAPVCAKSLLNDDSDLDSVLKMPRLHPSLDHVDWKSWLNASGYPVKRVRNSTFFTLDLALSACLSGQGATVTDLLLVLPELERGFLVCPEKAGVYPSPWKYYCHQKTQSPIVDELVDWFRQETDNETNKLTHLATKFGWDIHLT